MDARDWHRQATTPAPTWPDPVSITDFDALSRQCRDNYFRRLTGAMNATVVVSRPMEAVAAHLDDIVATNRLRPPGAMPMIAVTAPFSAGKSTLLKHWGFGVYRGVLGGQANEERPTWSPQPGVTADWVPVVYVTLMASSSIKEINALILLYLGYPPEGLARTTTTRVLHALRMHGVQVVILDDAHMLRTTSAQGRAVLDYIKFLNTELGEVNRGTVILVGAHLESTAILDDPQIRARLTTMTIDAFQITTIEKKAAWQDLLATVGDRPLQHLPNAAPDLFVARLAQHIWRRTQGFVGETTRLISRSVLDAVHDRRSVITHDDLDSVDLSDRSLDGQIDAATAARKTRR